MTASLGYVVDGPADAPALVLGSSLGTDHRMWDEFVPALARDHRVLRYDHRGHGASESPAGPYTLADLAGDVVGVLDHLGVETAHVGGLSLGGMVGMWLAAHVPERVRSLAVLCSSAHMPPAQAWLDRAAAVRAGGMQPVADAVVARWFTPAFAAAHPDVVERHRAMFEASEPEGYAGCCEAIAAMDLRPVLPRIGAPTLVIAGRDDPAAPQAHGEVVVDGVVAGGGLARLELVDGAHIATAESPQRCAELMLAHLAETEGENR